MSTPRSRQRRAVSVPAAMRRGRLARPQPSLYASRGVSREEEGPGRRAHCALAGQVLGHPPRHSPLLHRGHRGRRSFREAGVGWGLCLQPRTFKGHIQVICDGEQREHCVTSACGPLYIYSTRRLSPGPTWGRTLDPLPGAKLSLT